MPTKQIVRPIILPLLLSGLLVQAVVPMVRILTSYRALDEGHGPGMIGLLSAAFSLLPVLLTVTLGRMNDRGALGKVILVGALGTLGACLVFWLGPVSLVTLFVASTLLGIGQTAVLAGLQVATMHASTRAHRDAVLGNYMVAVSLGQAIGPMIVGFGQGNGDLSAVPVLGAVLLVLTTALVAGNLPRPRATGDAPVARLQDIAATRGLWWIVVFGSLCVTAQDLLLAFLPVYGVERGLTPPTVGLLLTARAIAAMVARLLFGKAVRRLGQMRLALLSAALGGGAMLVMVFPLPVLALGAVMVATGLGLGIALTCSVSLTMEIAPPRARGTALSIRMTAIRLAQFVLPLGAGLVVAPLGAGGTFALSGVSILCAAGLRPKGITRSGGRPL
jgi:MFS family permease